MSNIKSEPNLSYYPDDQDITQVENLLKNLTLYKLYKEIDMKKFKQTNSNDCNVCDTEIKVTNNSKPNLVKLCREVCNIMLNMGDNDIFCNETSCKDLCNHMKFWIYEHLLNITTDINEVNSFYKPLESIRKRNSAKWDMCYIKLYVNNNDFKIFKNTYDFLYTSSDIIDKISKTYDTEVELYCKHIKEFFRYYNSIKGSCTVSNQGICYNILEKFKTFFTYEGQLDNIYKNCKYEKTTCPSDSVVEEIPCLKDKEHESIHSKQIDYTHNVINIISRIAIFIIPIFGLLSIFYKFTPLGFWLRSRMRKKNNIHKNISEGEYDILENTSRTEKFYPECKEYNLKYQ